MVSKIQDLRAEAQTAEEKLRALEREHERLEEIIRFEATRQMLLRPRD